LIQSILATFDGMKTQKIQKYSPIEDSVPFSGIFSREQIQKGRKLFLERIRKDKEQALKKSTQKSKV
jgi:hypothetical protein